MARIKGILFDLGDTLLDFGPVDTRRLFAEGARLAYSYLRGLGQPVPPFRWFQWRQLWAIRWHYLKSRLTRREFNSLDVLGQHSAKMGQTLTPAQTLELAWLWYEPLAECAAMEEGLHELLSAFRSDGLAMAVVSNTFVPGQVLNRHLSQLGLLEYFAATVYSCDVVYRKPHPQIFRIVLEKLGVPAEEAMFVGDSLSVDVAGAARLGMVSVLKDPTGVKSSPGIRPTHRIARLDELVGIVAAHNKVPTGAGE